jgi:hypothetical protein
MAVHGDLLEVTYNHPTIGSGVFYPKANTDSTYNTGGFINGDSEDGITSNGQLIQEKTRIRAFFQMSIENDMNTRKDLETLKKLAADPAPANYTFSVVNGSVYSGAGIPVGNLDANVKTGLIDLKVVFGSLKKII